MDSIPGVINGLIRIFDLQCGGWLDRAEQTIEITRAHLEYSSVWRISARRKVVACADGSHYQKVEDA